MDKVLFSSAKTDWETPQAVYDELDREFHFTCDVAASSENRKHDNYYDEATDGLKQAWSGVCWCNPPYGREICKWVQKAYEESKKGTKTVMLIPARTDTKWFHEFIYGKFEVRFLKGRLKFGSSKSSAPFPSMVVVFRQCGRTNAGVPDSEGDCGD